MVTPLGYGKVKGTHFAMAHRSARTTNNHLTHTQYEKTSIVIASQCWIVLNKM